MLRGTRIGNAVIKAAVDGDGINEDIVDAVAEAGPGVEKEGDRQGKRFGFRFSEGFQSRLDDMRQKAASKLSKDMGAAGEAAGNHAGERAGKGFTKRLSDKVFDDDFAERIGSIFADKFLDSVQKRLDQGELELNVSGNSDDSVGGGSGGRGKRGTLIGDRLGGLFGAGSRNNALNLFGKSMANILNLTQLVGRGAKGMFGIFTEGFKSAADGASLLTKVGSGFGSVGGGIGGALSKLAASGPAAIAALVAVGVAMSLLATLASALTGIIVALASTVASALVAALAIGAGAMLAMVAAGGLLINMFTSLTDAQRKALSDGFKPIKEQLTGLGQIMAKDFLGKNNENVTRWANNVSKSLVMLVPLARVMGDAFAKAGDRITATFSGAGFKNLTKALAEELPDIVIRLSGAFRGFMNGLTGLFAAILPDVTEFAGWLRRVGRDFADWANSARGQNSIKDFIDRAIVSFQSFKGFIKEVSGLLSDLLFNPKGQKQGNGMFDGMTKAIRDFRKFIKSDNRIEGWFENAGELAEALGDAMVSLGDTFRELDSDGSLKAITSGIKGLAKAIDLVNKALSLTPLGILGKIGDLKNKFTGGDKGDNTPTPFDGTGFAPPPGNTDGPLPNGVVRMAGGGSFGRGMLNAITPRTIAEMLQQSGEDALWQTSKDHGGYKENAESEVAKAAKKGKKGKKAGYKNPYIQWAIELMDNGPSYATQIKRAIKDFNKQMLEAIQSALKATDGDDVTSAMASLAESFRDGGKDLVSTAQDALTSAAQSLAQATSKKEAKQALKEVKQSQKDLAAALAAQDKLQDAAKMLLAQGALTALGTGTAASLDALTKMVDGGLSDSAVTDILGRAKVLVDGLAQQNATLADYAEARGALATLVESANSKLLEAIQIKADFAKAVADGVKAFGALTTAQAQSVGGVEQALTAADITSNLEARLAKVRAFQENLKILLASGLSQDAYKQIVDAGVDGGAAYAAALVAGGPAAAQQVSDLVAQIGAAGDTLGSDASTIMYEAGVQAAQGLVAGLTSLTTELEAAATSLGERIARAIATALGIASPSKRLIDMMDYVGDGAVIGLDNQHTKVGVAAQRFSNAIAVSPEVAAYAAAQAGVSGNLERGQVFRDLVVNTPTTDPKAVAIEAVNEMVGRL